MICVGNPIRKEILNGSLREAQTLFKLTGEKPVVLVLGGSQGSQRINDKILTVLRDFLENFELIHQTGSNNFNQVKAEADTVIGSYSKPYYHPVAFLNDEELAHAYKAADFIISRAGAGSIFEIAAIGKPSILIPLPESAQNHQLQNAYAFSENGASIVLEEENFLPHFLLETLKNLFSQPKRIKQMGERALEFSKPESARIIGEYLISYLIQ
jgi:UDP-N-acetylglucosamine--N-acetylmuramyl-(pentapeptide) pyrophosphoryl-undecaprenol N-acetylglucosamine transferase